MGIYYFYNQEKNVFSEKLLKLTLTLKTIISLPPNHQYEELL